jgi:predicted GNAT family acetyltransferase
MSLYAEYLKEKTNDEIIESEDAFATYRFLNEKQVYIVDVYVKPHLRKQGIAFKMAEKIIEIAKAKGCTEGIGTVIPSNKGSTESVKFLLACGMTILSASENMIVLRKEI